MVGIGSIPVANYLTVYFCPTHDGVIHFFQNQHPSTLTHHKTITILIEGTRGTFRIIIACTHGLHCCKATHAHRHHCRLSSTGKNRLSITHFYRPPCFTQCMSAGGACTTGGHIGATQVVVNGEHARGHVQDKHWNGKGRHLTRTTFGEYSMLRFLRSKTANATSDITTDLIAVQLL